MNEMKPGYLWMPSLCPISFVSSVTSAQTHLPSPHCIPGARVFRMHKTACAVPSTPRADHWADTFALPAFSPAEALPLPLFL